MQGCGSGYGSGFNDFVDPGPDSESGSKGKKKKEITVIVTNFFLVKI
jgi:hypothetical protein